jgi:hypothetical protein
MKRQTYLSCMAMFMGSILLLTIGSAYGKFKGSIDWVNVEQGLGCSQSAAFSWDYKLHRGDEGGDKGNVIVKNKQSSEDSLRAKVGCKIAIDRAAEDDEEKIDHISMFLTKEKIKVTDHSIKFSKIIQFKDGIENTDSPAFVNGIVPKIKSGSYNFVVAVINNEELETYYIAKITISKSSS